MRIYDIFKGTGIKKRANLSGWPLIEYLRASKPGDLSFIQLFVGYGEFLSSFCTASGQYFPAVIGCHSFHKTMLVASFAL